jgi:hypothetical protein
MTRLGKWTVVCVISFLAMVCWLTARADGMVSGASLSGIKGTCTLNGAVSPTCTANVAVGCVPLCSYTSSSLIHLVSCTNVGGVLTVASATTLDTGVVSFVCL